MVVVGEGVGVGEGDGVVLEGVAEAKRGVEAWKRRRGACKEQRGLPSKRI